MPAKNNDKNKETLRELEKKISPILVVNNNSLKPYVESFQYFPENVYQQPLGILIGFFEIKEYSEDSAYIVNFLNSVLKKEYYINPKRPVTESLDSALHKVNVALSELAKHGNINWLGKLDGAVCILEKNNLHFSVAGDAKVLLYRSQAFNNISEGLASDSADPHPLKTFVNVSSGRLENKDKLLITSDDIFHILTLPQLTKNVQRFTEDQFIQFLRTALSNELEMASLIVVDAMQKKAASKKVVTPQEPQIEEELVNVFSEKTFVKKSPKDTAIREDAIPLVIEDSEYTDKKTGHIYIQGQTDEALGDSHWQAYLAAFKDHAADMAYETKKHLRRKAVSAKKTFVVLKNGVALRIAELQKERNKEVEYEEAPEDENEIQVERHIPITQIEEAPSENEPEIEEQLPQVAPAPKAKVLVAEIKPIAAKKETLPEKTNEEAEIIQNIPIRQSIQAILDEDELHIGKDKSAWKELFSKIRAGAADIIFMLKNKAQESTAAKRAWRKTTAQLNIGGLKKTVPDFRKAKQLFNRFTGKQQAYLLGTVAAIIILPLLAGKLMGGEKKAPVADTPVVQPTMEDILSQDKHIQLASQTNKLATLASVDSLLLFDNVPYAITAQKVVALQNQPFQEFATPLNPGEKVTGSAFMQDLQLILILTDQKRVLSFSPISQQFKDNSIQLPGSVNLEFAATYLTYLYLTDPGSGQIYRYPRAEGGFGEKSDWLKSGVALSGITSLTIDDSIYYVKENKINKLFKGQTETIDFENSQTPIKYTDIFTTIDLDNLYVLDAENSRVITYAKTGEIVKQYYSEDFKGATKLTVSEKEGAAYVVARDGVVKLAL